MGSSDTATAAEQFSHTAVFLIFSHSIPVFLESGKVFSSSTTCGLHSLFKFQAEAGLISCSPVLCGFLASAINSKHSNDASVALYKSLPAHPNAFLVALHGFDSANCFFSLKISSPPTIVSCCFVSGCGSDLCCH